MNVLSLFNGMSCGALALDRAGIKVDKYYSSEIDQYANIVTQANYPGTIQLGDILNWREWDIDWSSISLLIAGSPCQGFSFSGLQLEFDDVRSKLFFVFVDIWKHIKKLNPGIKFLLENVKMTGRSRDIISEYLGVQPVLINSSLVSAQNRKRYYWANWAFNQPEDTGILLKDIVDHEQDCSSLIISNTAIKRISPDKTGTLNTKNNSGQLSLDSGTTFIHFIGRGNNPAGARAINGKVPTLSASSWQQNNFLAWIKDNDISLRRLSPVECERLQNVPEDYTNHVSNTQRYKLLGNGWTINVIVYILQQLFVSEVENG